MNDSRDSASPIIAPLPTWNLNRYSIGALIVFGFGTTFGDLVLSSGIRSVPREILGGTLMIGSVMTSIILLIKSRRYIRRQALSGRECLECGYNLHGNTSGRCPECGTDVPERTETVT